LVASGCNTQTINTEGFETGWGIWTDGGTDCARINSNTGANSGSWSIQLRDNTTTSMMTTGNMNLTSYNQVTVNFGFYANSFENGEDFWLQISTNGGTTYTTVKTWVAGTNFTNNTHNAGTQTISGPFTSNTRFRFRADASADDDVVYIDDVVITGCVNFTGDPNELARNEVENGSVQATSAGFFAYPNPTSDRLIVEFTQTEGTATLVVLDMTGKLLHTQKVSSNSTGVQQVQLDLAKLVPGSYLLQVLDGKERRFLQFVKI
jgi:hypothetical protein